MAVPDELYDLLEHIQAQLPHDWHKSYEEAADRALQHHSRKHGFWWWEMQGPHEEAGVPAIFALVIGLIGGVALMYLFDPDHGEARRAMLRGEVHKLAEEAEVEGRRARDEAHKLVGEAEEVAGKARGEARKLVNEAEDEAHKLRGQANKAAGDVSSTADSAAKQVKSAADDVKKQVDDKTTPPKA